MQIATLSFGRRGNNKDYYCCTVKLLINFVNNRFSIPCNAIVVSVITLGIILDCSGWQRFAAPGLERFCHQYRARRQALSAESAVCERSATVTGVGANEVSVGLGRDVSPRGAG